MSSAELAQQSAGAKRRACSFPRCWQEQKRSAPRLPRDRVSELAPDATSRNAPLLLQTSQAAPSAHPSVLRVRDWSAVITLSENRAHERPPPQVTREGGRKEQSRSSGVVIPSLAGTGAAVGAAVSVRPGKLSPLQLPRNAKRTSPRTSPAVRAGSGGRRPARLFKPAR